MGGRLVGGDPRASFRGASIDSRSVAPGELFFALPGSHADGHRFVGEALSRGAVAAVVSRSAQVAAEGALVQVDDPMTALHDLTGALRAELPCRVVGITGSAGKTTTKELLADMLARRYRVARSPGNLNNLLGFPLAFLGIADDCEWMVAEMGMSTPGEMGRLSRLVRPDVAVYTNVREVHLEFFGTLRAIAAAKAELLEGLAVGGPVVANRDDPEVRWIVRELVGRVTWYGIDGEAEIVAHDVRPRADGGSRFRLATPAGSVAVELGLLGRHNVENFLAAAAAATLLGVAPREIAAAAATSRPAAMRGVVRRRPDGATVVDDSYNANPAAVERALEGASLLPGRRRWAVLGDMLELGPEAPRMHREVGAQAARRGFDPVFGVGELSRHTVAGADDGGARAAWYATAAEVAPVAAAELVAGDVVLVKGSRGVGLERVVTAMLAAEAAG